MAFLPAPLLYFSCQSSVFLPASHKEREQHPFYVVPLCHSISVDPTHVCSTDLLFVNFWDRLNIVDEGKK